MKQFFIFIDFGYEHIQLEFEGSLKEAMHKVYQEAKSRKQNPSDVRISPKPIVVGHEPDNDGWQTISPIERL